MGFYSCSFPELAPAHDDVAHVRMSVVRVKPRRASLGKRLFPQHCGGAAFYFARADHQQHLGKRVCCGGFCHSSIASRIGGVDCGTKGRAQRRIFHAHAPGLLPLDPKTNGWPLPGDVDLVRVRSDVETDVDYDANHLALARLLAAKQKSEVRGHRSEIDNRKAHLGEGPIVCVVDWILFRDFMSATLCARFDSIPAAATAGHQRALQLW